MSLTYLLPCPCGQKIPVETTLAGESVVCRQCGQTVEVPTLLRLKQLEMVSIEDSKSAWGTRQKVFLVGLVIIAAGIGVTVWCLLTWPLSPADQITHDHLVQYIDNFTLLGTYREWETLRRGVTPFPGEEKYHAAVTHHQFWLVVCGLILVAGVVVLIVGFSIPSQPRRIE
ncbi:MAG: hypothetical protein JW818_13275 [Pirellulales bacterium]|nr:hypothetical protein [Pirellulales bacterium]